MKRLIAAALILTASTAFARWGFKLSHCDPFNKNSGLRQTLCRIDPSQIYTDLKSRIVYKVGRNIGEMPEVEKHAEKQGWTTDRCRVAGLGMFTSIAAFQGVAICAACVAGEPVSTTVCASMIVGAGGVITEIACTTLCHNHKLRDCP